MDQETPQTPKQEIPTSTPITEPEVQQTPPADPPVPPAAPEAFVSSDGTHFASSAELSAYTKGLEIRLQQPAAPPVLEQVPADPPGVADFDENEYFANPRKVIGDVAKNVENRVLGRMDEDV